MFPVDPVAVHVNKVLGTSDCRGKAGDCPLQIEVSGGVFVKCGSGLTHIVNRVSLPVHFEVAGVIVYRTLPCVDRALKS